MSPRTLLRVASVAFAVFLSACSGESGSITPTEPNTPPQPIDVAVTLSESSGSPTKVVFVTFPSNRPAGETTIRATLGTDTVDVTVVDPLTGAFLVPDGAPGQRRLEIPLASLEIGVATFQVLAAPVIADPEQVVEDRVEDATAALDSLVTEIEQGLLQSLSDEDAAEIRTWIAEVRAGADQLTLDEARELALWLESNADALSDGASSVSGASLVPDWVSWDSFWASVTTRKIAIVKNILICAVLLDTTPLTGAVGAVAVGVCLAALITQTLYLLEEMEAQFSTPVIAIGAELDRSGSQVAAPSSSADGPTSTSASAVDLEIDHGAPKAVRLLATYRPLNAGDGGIAGDIIGIVDELRMRWQTVTQYVDAAPDFPSLFSTGSTVTSVESGSVTLSGVSGTGVTCSAEAIDSGVSVDCRNGTTDAQAVTLDLTHTNRYGSVSTTVSATVYRPQPASVTITGGNGQVGVAGAEFGSALEVQVMDVSGSPVVGYPVSWIVSSGSGSILSSGGTTDDSGKATAQVQAGSAGSLNVTVAATDRRGNVFNAVFDLEAAGADGTATLSLVGLSPTTYFEDTNEGIIGTQCNVTLTMAVTGNVPVQWIRRGFTITPRGGSESPYSESTDISGSTAPGITLDWLTDWRFWSGDLEGFDQDMWVEYSIEGGPTKRTSTSWTCDPPGGSVSASISASVGGVSTFTDTDSSGAQYTGTQCNVTLNVTASGSVPVEWIGYGFTITPIGGGAPYTETATLGTASMTPASLPWLTNHRFWMGNGGNGFTQRYWVDYQAPKGSPQRTEVSWTCRA